MTAPQALQAQWFDGRSSRARPAALVLVPGRDGPGLRLQALDGAREVLELAHGAVGWPERWSARRAPPRVVVDLGAHGSVQVEDVPGWQAAMATSGWRPSLAERMQTRWPFLLGVLLLAGAAVWGFYRWGTPWAATQITRHVPLAWELRLSNQVMAELDERYVKPSKLPPERQAELRAGFDKLVAQIGPDLRRYRGYQPRLNLQFRSGMPPNAFALPGGTIVMTDAMVEQARLVPGTGEPALLGVLAHEIGHVVHRHTTRMVVEQGVLNVGLGLALGDVSSLVSMGASMLTGLSYQRSHETESDCYAIAMMRQAGLPTAPMADLLLGIEDEAEEKARRVAAREAAKRGASAPVAAASAASAAAPADASRPRRNGGGGNADWFSTHPDTAGRAERLKAGRSEGCG